MEELERILARHKRELGHWEAQPVADAEPDDRGAADTAISTSTGCPEIATRVTNATRTTSTSITTTESNIRRALYSTPTVSFHSLKRARTTIEDFVKTYFLFHGLEAGDFFQYMPILLFVEATIYQMDEENEQLALAGGFADGGDNRNDIVILQGEQVLREVLDSEGLLSEGVLRELENGRKYWRAERRLCSSVREGLPIAEEEVHRGHGASASAHLRMQAQRPHTRDDTFPPMQRTHKQICTFIRCTLAAWARHLITGY